MTLQPASSSARAAPIIQRHRIHDLSNDDNDIMTTATPLSIVIMAAGKGTRMKSNRPKALHPLAGRPLLQHVLNAVAPLSADKTLLVVGHGADQVQDSVRSQAVTCVLQEPQLGTGHAVQQVVAHLPDAGTTLILNGDVPLISTATARALVATCAGARLALLTVELADATGYGRIVRDDATIRAIVEHKDATPAQRAIREVYTGMLAAPTAWLKRAVMALNNDNAQKEYYLTDIAAAAVAEGLPVVASMAPDETEVLGVNSPAQLADLERRLQRRHADALMDAGVRLADPARIDIRGTLRCGRDVSIDVGCVFEGEVVLGDEVSIGAHCVMRDMRIDAGAVIQPFTHAVESHIGPGAIVGPFARLRPGADLGAEVHIGNFVEVKNSTLAHGAKANHLAYLGDATVGERVNYGAGSITANYDGANKHRTVIGNDVHVGSNCVLVAPVTVGDGATIGGGSTIVEDAPAGKLSLARGRQVTIENWQRPKKKKP
jgi:bifunctional UDP-N-acetylglucosamine pyrophosphorylase/glucosamine-1-phosphate N-acetyltransferase